MYESWPAGEVRALPLERLGESYRRYRLSSKESEEQMARSLLRHGQIAPIVVVVRDDQAQVIDGFKRLTAARSVDGLATLTARCLDVDERGAKAAIYTLNQVGRHLQELEEAWIVFALVREDGLSQLEAATLLGRHKSWAHRRLALLERLSEECKADMRLGLISVTIARQLIRLPRGNQSEVMQTQRREQLSTRELSGVVDLLLASAARDKEEYILSRPREALVAAQGHCPPSWDPRLSSAGNRTSKQLGSLLDGLSRMENWLRHRGRAEMLACDRRVLRASFEKLAVACRAVAELTDDLLSAMPQR